MSSRQETLREQRQKPVQRRKVFMCVLYFGWPNQPSSGTMKILHWNVIFLLEIFVIPEIRKNDRQGKLEISIR